MMSKPPTFESIYNTVVDFEIVVSDALADVDRAVQRARDVIRQRDEVLRDLLARAETTGRA